MHGYGRDYVPALFWHRWDCVVRATAGHCVFNTVVAIDDATVLHAAIGTSASDEMREKRMQIYI